MGLREGMIRCFLDTFLEPMIGNPTVLLAFCERKIADKITEGFMVFFVKHSIN